VVAAGSTVKSLHWLLKRTGQIVGRNKLSILIYHQVVKDTDPMRPDNTPADEFRWHMKLLRDYFNPISLAKAAQHLRNRDLPANSVCVTFDDGYLNNLEVAQPILEAFSIPATVFVATGFCNGTNMWNDRLIDLIGDPQMTTVHLNALGMGSVKLSSWESRGKLVDTIIPGLKYQEYCKREKIIDALYLENSAREAARKMMSQDEIALLAQKGVDIGAHTVDHPILKSLAAEEQRRQIAESKQLLEKLTGFPVTGFAYPNGKPGSDYDATTIQLVKETGFEYAVSTTWGISTPNTNRYELNRFTPWDKNPGKFHLRMLRGTMGF
jgi:peptidoglycan/xylan/chitin deacetylase (PgdA/CDA1 family)